MWFQFCCSEFSFIFPLTLLLSTSYNPISVFFAYGIFSHFQLRRCSSSSKQSHCSSVCGSKFVPFFSHLFHFHLLGPSLHLFHLALCHDGTIVCCTCFIYGTFFLLLVSPVWSVLAFISLLELSVLTSFLNCEPQNSHFLALMWPLLVFHLLGLSFLHWLPASTLLLAEPGTSGEGSKWVKNKCKERTKQVKIVRNWFLCSEQKTGDRWEQREWNWVE